jgi:hypothetical protein
MTKPNKEVERFLSGKADVVIPLEREGGLSATEVLATHSWFRQRVNELKSSGGRPTNPQWTIKRQIPMTSEIWEQLKDLAGRCGEESSVRVGAGQLASFLLEDAVVALAAGDISLKKVRRLRKDVTVTGLPEPQDARARAWEPRSPFFWGAPRSHP